MGSAAPADSEFITKEFLESVLKNKVDSFTVQAGSNLGDNYTSVLHGINVYLENSDKPMHLLLKAFPTDVARQKFLEEMNIFFKEMRVYNTLIPELKKFAEEQHKLGDGKGKILYPAVPPFVHAAVRESANGGTGESPGKLDNYILMVDIRKTWGFKMASRWEGLDFDHCCLVLTELAKYHALNWSYCVNNRMTCMKEKFSFMYDVFSLWQEPGKPDMMGMLMKTNMDMLKAALEDTLGAESEIVKGFRQFCDVFLKEPTKNFIMFVKENEPIDEDEILSLVRVKPQDRVDKNKPWVIGTHGDCWVNNMLFKYDPTTGKPIEAVLLDLQMVREACPTIDLNYFIYSSTAPETREKHLDALLQLYATKFLQFCKELNAEPLPGFSFDELKKRFHRSKPFGLLSACMILPLIMQSAEDAVDLQKVEIDDSVGDDAEKLALAFTQMCKDTGKDSMLRKRIVGVTTEMYKDGII